jgi:iron complex outermembrane receptor protein
VKLSFADHDQHKGYFYNIPTGKDQGRNNYKSYGIHLLSNVTDTVELQYILRNEKTVEDAPPLVNMAQPDTLFCGSFGLCAQSLTTPSSGDRYKTNTLIFQPTTWQLSPPPDGIVTSTVDTLTRNLDPATFNATTNIFKAQWKVSDAVRMDYIFGSYKTKETIVSNWTAESVMMFGTDRPAEYSQKSHELRMSYNSGGPLNFVVGAYKWDSEYDIRLRSWITFVVPGVVLDIPQNTHQETSSKAAFFDGDYAFNDRWTLNVGGRYTKDEKLSRQRGNLSTAPDDPTAAWTEFTPKVSLRYKLLDDTMLFASYSKGYRSGGFNGRVDSQDSARDPYNPEYVNNYEAGIKSEWLDHRLRLNGSVFYMSYKDKQEEIGLRSTGATGQRITVFNAASATLKGAELELQAQATQHLNLRANVGLLDTKYDKFTYDSGFGIVDNSGLKFRRAPKFTGSLDFTYTQAIGAGEAWVRGSYHHIGEHFIEQSNRPELHNNAENLVDLSVNYSIKDMSFSVFGRNLTGEDAWAHALNVSGLWAYASPIAPRTFGAEATFKFGGN